MIKRVFPVLFLFLLALSAFSVGRAKYVFYFIGDGMGVNQVNGTQTYLAALEGHIGVRPLCFTAFPEATIVTTFSATNGVTDSAAAGTALATAHKTKNDVLGMAVDGRAVESIASAAKRAGAAVGITTSVSPDHATPAAFYAHQGARGSYYAIGKDLVAADFDLYAGSELLEPIDKNDKNAPSVFELARKAGYTTVRGTENFQKKAEKAEKILLLQPESDSRIDPKAIPYAIDRKPGNMTLSEITRSAISFLSSRQKDGFFLMVEGGKIDWACHSNDAATAFREVIDLDSAVRVAYDFYLQHPDETLIVVTADHETGGISLGVGPYSLHTDLFAAQKMSTEAYSKHVVSLKAAKGESLTWEEMKSDLQTNWGFFETIRLNATQEELLKTAFSRMMSGDASGKKTLYAETDAFAEAARRIMAESALIGWQSTGHSNGFVPLYAIGVGAERFRGQMDNTQIPIKIAEAAGYNGFPTP